MPRYVFECHACVLRFERVLKMDQHATHPCPSCGDAAARMFDGQNFGSFSFASPDGAAPANTGVHKQDYPTADQAVGESAEARWTEYQARSDLKQRVREKGGTHALIRRTEPGYIEYEAMNPSTREARKALTREAIAALKESKKKA